MYDAVLIPTDGSPHAARAAAHGSRLAAAFDATVHLVTVVDVQDAAGPFNAGGVDRAFVERLRERGRETLAEVEGLIDAESLTTAVVEGEPRQAILEYVSAHDIDLVAMGTRGRTGIGRYVAGSVCEHVVRHSPVPVVSVRALADSDDVHAEPEISYDDVLIPTDGSDPAEAAVDHGLAVARATGATVHAVNVVDVRTIAATSGSGIDDVLGQLRARGRRATEAVTGRAVAEGIDATAHLLEGSPAEALLDYAAETDVDLIAMGTTGRTGLDRILLGSTAERVIRRADAPVLSVSARGRTDAA